MRTYSPTDIARQDLFVREIPQNRGQRVEAIQHWCGGQSGDSWCCYFVSYVLDKCYQGNSPIGRQGSCQYVYDLAKQNNWLVDKPLKDDLFLYIDDNDHAHHIGIVTVDGGLYGIAGNTSADGTSSNGDGVHEHGLINNPTHIKFVRVPN
jgi:hypothetical protein